MQLPYVQQQRLAPLGWWLITGLVALALVATRWVEAPAGRIGGLVAAGILLLVLLNFDKLSVVVTPQELKVGYPVFKSRVRIDAIERVHRLERISAWRWGGLGIRLGLRGELCYLARSGPGIRLEVKGRGGDLTFSCATPESILEAIDAARARGSAA